MKGLEGDVAFSCVSQFTEGSLALDVYGVINTHGAVFMLGSTGLCALRLMGEGLHGHCVQDL